MAPHRTDEGPIPPDDPVIEPVMTGPTSAEPTLTEATSAEPTMDAPAFDAAPAQPSLGSVVQGSSLYLVGNIVSKIVGFVMIPFYARFLSTDQYGVLNLLELATTLVAISFGLQSMAQSLTRLYHDEADAQARRVVVSTALFATMAASGLVVLVGVAFAEPLSRAISLGGDVGLLRAAFVATFFGSVAEVILAYERIQQRTGFFLIYSLVTLVATLSLNIALIGWWHLGVWGFVCSKLAVTGAGCVFLLWRAARQVGLGWSGEVARRLARFAGPLIVSGAAFLAIHFSDRLFLAHVSRAEVGVYALAYTFAFQLSVLIGDSFNKSWGVSFYSFASGEGWQNRFVQVARWLVFVLGAGSLGISLFGRDVLVLMVPRSYDPPLLLLPLLVFGYFLREVGDFFNGVLLIGSGSGLMSRIAVFGAVLNLGLNAALIPLYGIWGAAWATFATWAIYCAVCWAGAWRLRGVAMRPGSLLAMLAISGACLWLRHRLGTPGPIASLALDCAGFGVFMMLAVLLYLRRSERQDAAGLVRKLIAHARISLNARLSFK